VQTRTDTPVLDQSSQLAVKGATQPDNWIDAERVARENALTCYRNPAPPC
jgi:hypothetical protein